MHFHTVKKVWKNRPFDENINLQLTSVFICNCWDTRIRLKTDVAISSLHEPNRSFFWPRDHLHDDMLLRLEWWVAPARMWANDSCSPAGRRRRAASWRSCGGRGLLKPSFSFGPSSAPTRWPSSWPGRASSAPASTGTGHRWGPGQMVGCFALIHDHRTYRISGSSGEGDWFFNALLG
jgi:hypothetical protein